MAVSSISYQLRVFFTWWGEELTSLMPESLLSLFRNGRPLQLFYADKTLRLVNHGVTGEEVHSNYLSGIDFNDPDQKRVLSGASEIRLCLEKKKYLIKKVTLPIETEENLWEVLSFEMDRQTPFTADQVYYDYVISGRDKQARTLEVTLILAPIDKLTYALDVLHEHEIVINAISPCEEHNGVFNRVNLLPPERREKPQKGFRYINYFLLLVFFLLLLANLALPVWQKSIYAKTLEQEVADYKKQSAEAVELRTKVDQAKLENKFLEERKKGSLQVLQILNELTLVVPDDTWVSNFEVRSDVVHLHGQSVASASLISLIDASPLFKNVSFRSPVTQNRQNNTERFHISTDMELPGESAE
ncbi:MAG: PilN domain-containing protein [Candidatus Thiodiazotropha sp. (ex Myrtea sp. 'scaly one' KF741663)]|nr:PilN domain-containing protein [Candidatus Thiodiazotropha sp. (ex Myrtea sp. 'scaly one' KF741663)]